MTQHQNEVLDRSSFFRFLPEDRADCLRAVLQEEHFEFGDVIVREGDEADACYILVTAGLVSSRRSRRVKRLPWPFFARATSLANRPSSRAVAEMPLSGAVLRWTLSGSTGPTFSHC